MAESDTASDLGYGKPPRHTQFVKGKSGNPKGRPKGSQNLGTILEKAGRQRIKITENGRTRLITKFEAAVLQLFNRAVSGDLKAIGELLAWLKASANSEQAVLVPVIPHESDSAVMANMIERIRYSEPLPGEKHANPSVVDACQPEERA